MVMQSPPAGASSPRRRRKVLGGWIAAAAMLSAGGALAAIPRPEATVDAGVLSGVQAPGLSVFRGIPYATPPVGPLRWKAPLPPQPWTGVRDASAFGAACPQDDAHKEAWAQVGRKSEDCLTLNVWAPQGRARRR